MAIEHVMSKTKTSARHLITLIDIKYLLFTYVYIQGIQENIYKSASVCICVCVK